MDLHLSNNPTLKTPEPEPESDTPTRIQPVKALTFNNGVLKRYPSLNHHHHHPIVVTYKECLKNHAAAIGGHAVDGCGEFMPSPTANPADPTSLKCAACGCHRNFHRREPDDPINPLPLPLPAPPITATATATPALEYQPHNRHHPPHPQPPRGDSGISTSPNSSPSPPPISSTYYPSAPHVLLALSHGLSAATTTTTTPPSDGSSRKRHRTRFSHDQKQRMLEFSERLGWKMQKRDEDVINDFCREIGVDRGVFKVWMHNNKNHFGQKKEDAVFLAGSLNGNGNGNGVSYGAAAATTTVHDGNGESKDNIIIGVHNNNNNNNHSSGVHVVGTNGSSSTS